MEKLTELHLKIQTRTAALEIVPKDRIGKLSKDYLRVALDAVAASASFYPELVQSHRYTSSTCVADIPTIILEDNAVCITLII